MSLKSILLISLITAKVLRVAVALTIAVLPEVFKSRMVARSPNILVKELSDNDFRHFRQFYRFSIEF